MGKQCWSVRWIMTMTSRHQLPSFLRHRFERWGVWRIFKRTLGIFYEELPCAWGQVVVYYLRVRSCNWDQKWLSLKGWDRSPAVLPYNVTALVQLSWGAPLAHTKFKVWLLGVRQKNTCVDPQQSQICLEEGICFNRLPFFFFLFSVGYAVGARVCRLCTGF